MTNSLRDDPMTARPSASHSGGGESQPSPVGIVLPDDPDLERLLHDAEEGRLREAEQRLAQARAIHEPPAAPGESFAPGEPRVWLAMADGLVALLRGDAVPAEAHLWRAVAWSLYEASGPPHGEKPTPPAHDLIPCSDGRGEPAGSLTSARSWRIAARAFEALGRLHRRRDEVERAADAHGAAYRLRAAHGSVEEQWESALSLAVTASLRREGDAGRRWVEHAQRLAARCQDAPRRRLAATLDQLARLLMDEGDHVGAVRAAREARHGWRAEDPTGLAPVRADVRLAHCLIRRAEARAGEPGEACLPILDEALELLGSSADELAAFGAEAGADLRWCRDQQDFALRLRAVLVE